METIEKEVYFGKYCPTCKYEKVSGQDDPGYMFFFPEIIKINDNSCLENAIWITVWHFGYLKVPYVFGGCYDGNN